MSWNRDKTLDEVTQRVKDDDDRIITEIKVGRVEPDIDDLRIGESRSFDLAVLHIDIVNFSAKTGMLPILDQVRFLNTFQSEMTHIVHDYDGTVEKYVGDRVTALFGIGEEEEKAVQHCIDAALTMKSEIHHIINPHLETHNLPSFSIRIGLDFGNVLFARTGIHGDNQFTLVGNTVTVASKLEEQASSNEILLGGEFYEKMSTTEKSYCIAITSPNNWTWIWKNPQVKYPIYKYIAHWNNFYN